jgi:hypothetical protein
VTDPAVEVAVQERERGHPQDDPPAGSQELAEFGQSAVVVFDVLQDVDQDHAVKRTVRDGRVDRPVQDLHRLRAQEPLAQPADAALR